MKNPYHIERILFFPTNIIGSARDMVFRLGNESLFDDPLNQDIFRYDGDVPPNRVLLIENLPNISGRYLIIEMYAHKKFRLAFGGIEVITKEDF